MADGFGNLDRLSTQISLFGEGAQEGIEAALIDEAETIMELSRDVYAPISTPKEAAKRGVTPGGLRRSHRVVPGGIANPDLAFVDVIVGGSDSEASYALYVHERLELHHNPPTQAKFLERAANERATSDFTLRIGERVVAAAKSRAGL